MRERKREREEEGGGMEPLTKQSLRRRWRARSADPRGRRKKIRGQHYHCTYTTTSRSRTIERAPTLPGVMEIQRECKRCGDKEHVARALAAGHLESGSFDD